MVNFSLSFLTDLVSVFLKGFFLLFIRGTRQYFYASFNGVYVSNESDRLIYMSYMVKTKAFVEVKLFFVSELSKIPTSFLITLSRLIPKLLVSNLFSIKLNEHIYVYVTI